jgi:hypothetical protein
MAKRKRKASAGPKTKHRLYVIKFWLDNGDVVHKIGYTSKSAECRLLQILGSFLQVYGYSPRAKVIQHELVKGGYGAEQALHKVFSNDRYSVDEGISGYTEFFKLDSDKLTIEYWKAIGELCTPAVSESSEYKKNVLY